MVVMIQTLSGRQIQWTQVMSQAINKLNLYKSLKELLRLRSPQRLRRDSKQAGQGADQASVGANVQQYEFEPGTATITGEERNPAAASDAHPEGAAWRG